MDIQNKGWIIINNHPSAPKQRLHSNNYVSLSPRAAITIYESSDLWFYIYFPIRGAAKKKTGFFWEISPKCGWVGWLTPKQGPNTLKPPQITPKIAFFDPNFTFRSPKSHKNPGVGGWVNIFGKDLPKKTFFLDAFPIRQI